MTRRSSRCLVAAMAATASPPSGGRTATRPCNFIDAALMNHNLNDSAVPVDRHPVDHGFTSNGPRLSGCGYDMRRRAVGFLTERNRCETEFGERSPVACGCCCWCMESAVLRSAGFACPSRGECSATACWERCSHPLRPGDDRCGVRHGSPFGSCDDAAAFVVLPSSWLHEMVPETKRQTAAKRAGGESLRGLAARSNLHQRPTSLLPARGDAEPIKEETT